MNLKTIVNKIVEGSKILMVQPTMIFRVLGDESLDTLHYVDKDETGRPDLIADKYYGDHRMVDIILKYNRISDPFSIIEGELLRIPKKEIAYYKLERPNLSEASNKVKDQFIDTKRLPPKDQAKIDRLKKKYGKDELLPPNVVPSGQKTYEFDGEGIRLGKQAQTAAVTSSTTLEKFKGSDTELIDLLDDAALNDGKGSGSNNSNNSNNNPLENKYDEGYAAGVNWATGNVSDTTTGTATFMNDGINSRGGAGGAGGAGGNGGNGGNADSTGDNNSDGSGPQGGGNANGGDDSDSPCSK